MEINSSYPVSSPVTMMTENQSYGQGPSRELITSEQQDNRMPISKEELQKSIEGLNKWLQLQSTHLKFFLHEGLNEYYVQVINDETNEVVREIPSKKVLDMVKHIQDTLGLIIDEKR
ncbi:flagellar protein FlaG [Brevibacillus migulae]|uniref:flagellar protein FlaG n=1 Tax=Brevibacillus migulae TaxID=1644114 RepID=UPI00106E5F87|nr:flagellar protein FlaG [Brevibacillus migulae]